MNLIVLSAFLLLSCAELINADVNGGSTCAACSILVGLAEQLAQVHDTDVVSAVQNYLCVKLPQPFDKACSTLLERFGSVLIDGIYHKATPDIICHDIGLCTQEAGTDFCHLFPLPSNFKNEDFQFRPRAPRSPRSSVKDVNDYKICSLPGISEVCEIIDNFANDHLPIQDKDKDKFSTTETLRGTHWRGKDCNDDRKDVYPGRLPLSEDNEFDSNCNGIYGRDPSSGRTYEEMLCSESNPRGIAILGDSAGAHFHIPPEYFMVESYTKETFQDLLMIAADELDWPELSSVTAHTANEWPHSIDGPVDSLYMRMLNDNKCIHRDYQNIAVNGAKSSNMHETMHGLARNMTSDYPLLVVLSLIGNDVCNGHADTIARMTSVSDYRSNMITTLNYLNTILPKESTVLITGLADGRVLWDTMSDRVHPIGKLNGDVKYKDLYAYLNCLEVSPCRGWMNSNATLRDITSERAANLSAQAKDITESMTFEQFDMVYVDYDIQHMMDDWQSRGGEDWEIIEPVDGFHPGQVGQALSAEYIYDTLTSKFPNAVGKVNPYNEKISEMFGEQGGY